MAPGLAMEVPVSKLVLLQLQCYSFKGGHMSKQRIHIHQVGWGWGLAIIYQDSSLSFVRMQEC